MTTPRRTRDPEARIAAIRQAAADIIVDTGVDSLTHRAVAARAGVAVGTTTKYFSSIDSLRKAAVEVLVEQLDVDIEYIQEILESSQDLPADLADAVLSWLTDPQRLFSECSLSYSGLFDEDLRELSVLWYRRLHQTLAPRVGGPQAVVLTQLLDGMMLTTALTGEIPPRDHVVSAIAALIAMDTSEDDREGGN